MSASPRPATDPGERGRLLRLGLQLEYATLAWNVFEGAVVLFAAWRAHSIGMAGFGLDSLIEIFASMVVVWQLKGADRARERRAMRLIGGAFFLVAAYILGQLVFTLTFSVRPAPSTLGLIVLAATVAAMLTLAWGKNRVGRRMANPVLIAEARVTLIDAALAFTVFLGVAANALFSWWWADPLSGVVIVFYAVREGRAAWRAGVP